MVSCCEAPLSCGGGINSRRGWCQAAWKEEQAEEELGEEEEKVELLVGRKQQEAEAGMEEKAAVGEEVQPPRHPGARRQDRVYVETLDRPSTRRFTRGRSTGRCCGGGTSHCPAPQPLSV